MSLVRGFTLGSAIELQDGVDTDFPDSLGNGALLGAEGEFALVFMAAEFAFDGSASFFQDVLVASEKIAMLVALPAFRSASLPIKPISAVRAISPDTFFQTKWKSSIQNHMFSPLPATV